MHFPNFVSAREFTSILFIGKFNKSVVDSLILKDVSRISMRKSPELKIKNDLDAISDSNSNCKIMESP